MYEYSIESSTPSCNYLYLFCLAINVLSHYILYRYFFTMHVDGKNTIFSTLTQLAFQNALELMWSSAHASLGSQNLRYYCWTNNYYLQCTDRQSPVYCSILLMKRFQATLFRMSCSRVQT
jgi:hypothetical protein